MLKDSFRKEFNRNKDWRIVLSNGIEYVLDTPSSEISTDYIMVKNLEEINTLKNNLDEILEKITIKDMEDLKVYSDMKYPLVYYKSEMNKTIYVYLKKEYREKSQFLY